MDKISIIMPCYNAEAHVATGVASVLGQTFEDIELIIINDGSTDGTSRILTDIVDTRVKIIMQGKRGVSAARNRGLKEAKGSFIAFLDADDTWKPDCLEKLHHSLISEEGAVLAYCGWQNVGLPGGRGEPYIPPDYEKERKLEHLLRCCPWPIHAALVRQHSIVDAGGFDERFSHAEDYALWLRIAAFHKIVRVPEVMAFYHFHEGPQASRDRGRVAYGQFRVQVEFLKTFPRVGPYLGREKVRALIYGGLLKEGFTSYWYGDLETAREIFREVMKAGYGTLSEWKYLLPALLPFPLHRGLITLFSKKGASGR